METRFTRGGDIARRGGNRRRWQALSFGLAVAGLACLNCVQAGQAFWDLNDAADTNEFIIRGSGPDGGAWIQEPDGNGAIQVTGAADSQYGAILFPDFDDGLVVKAFTFECLIKLGDGENPPADGFSLNYASVADPVVEDILAGGNGTGFAGSQDNGGDELNLPEEGTVTGLGIGFDTWGLPGGSNGPEDVRGISVRVNGTQVTQIPLPTLLVTNPGGDPADPTSLETGPPGGGTGTNLTWQPLRVELDEQGVINVFWKNVQVLTNFQTQFFPIPGRIVFAGRTGGNHAIQWVDDIRITTIPSTTFLVTGLRGDATGFEVTVNDAEGSELNPETISLSLNGETLEAGSYQVSKSGNVSTISYSTLPEFFAPGITNQVNITAQDNNGVEASLQRSFVVRPYIQLDPAWIADASEYDTASPGFVGRVNQIAIGRFPGDANNVWNALRHLAGGYIDPSTGNPYPNLVDPAGGFGGVDEEGNFEMPDDTIYFDPWININQDVLGEAPAEIGRFTSTVGPQYADTQLPGIPGSGPTESNTDNIVAEFFTYVELEGPNLYTFVVNSDDGFRVSFGPETRSALFTAPGGASTSANAGQFSGGKGSSDVEFDVIVPEGGSGVYQTRLVWWEGGGGANLEFFTVESDGTAALVGDTEAGGVPAYKPSGEVQVPAAVVSVAPWPGQAGVAPDSEVQIILADGPGQEIDANAVAVRFNGEPVDSTATRVEDTVRVTVPSTGLLTAGTDYDVEIDYTAGGESRTESYRFMVVDYPTLPASLGTDPGTAAEPGIRWRTYQVAVSHGTTIAGAESTLAGELGPSIHDPQGHTTPQGEDGFFNIEWVNFSQDPVAEPSGNFTATAVPPQDVPDEGIPGIPGTGPAETNTDNIAAEALTFLELDAGFHRMVVNSDDGFLVTTGTADDPKRITLGQFDGGRGAADTTFFFNVQEPGVYFFRLLWFEGGGGANVEWFTIDADGVRSLVGGQQADSIPAFRTRTVPEPTVPSEAVLNPPTIADGEVTITWIGTGTLQQSTDLETWTDVSPQPAANTFTVTPEAEGGTYYRLNVGQ